MTAPDDPDTWWPETLPPLEDLRVFPVEDPPSRVPRSHRLVTVLFVYGETPGDTMEFLAPRSTSDRAVRGVARAWADGSLDPGFGMVLR